MLARDLPENQILSVLFVILIAISFRFLLYSFLHTFLSSKLYLYSFKSNAIVCVFWKVI
jgi:hypothetical protein